MPEYSKNEVKLFRSINPKWTTEKLEQMTSPILFYNMLAVHAFAYNLQGNHIEALRRALHHLHENRYRGNEEFEKLIEF